MSNLGGRASRLVGFIAMWLGLIGAAQAREFVPLTDAQLDVTTAGVTFAGAIGDGEAVGMQASGRVVLVTVVGQGNEANTIATGQVVSSASSAAQSGAAMASSSLSLIVVIP